MVSLVPQRLAVRDTAFFRRQSQKLLAVEGHDFELRLRHGNVDTMNVVVLQESTGSCCCQCYEASPKSTSSLGQIEWLSMLPFPVCRLADLDS